MLPRTFRRPAACNPIVTGARIRRGGFQRASGIATQFLLTGCPVKTLQLKGRTILTIVNAAVRVMVLTFVFIGGAITLAGPELVVGEQEPELQNSAALEEDTKQLSSSREPKVTLVAETG